MGFSPTLQKIFEEDIPRRKIPTRIEKLKSKISIYNAKVIFRPGISNIADYLSRKSHKIVEFDDNQQTSKTNKCDNKQTSKMPRKCAKQVKFKIRQINSIQLNEPYNITIDEIAKETKLDTQLSELSECISKVRSIRNNKRLKQFKNVFTRFRITQVE